MSNRSARREGGAEAAVEVDPYSPVLKGEPLLPFSGWSVPPEAEAAAEAPLLPAWVASYGPMSENIQGGSDERRRVSDFDDVTAYPWRAICRLEITAVTGKRYLGTGWLISPRVLATAGHNVFMHNQGGWAQRIDVFTPFGNYASDDFRTVTGWAHGNPQSAAGQQSDYGAIILPNDLDVGYFGVAVYPDADLLAMTVNVYGYPFDKDDGMALWGDFRKLVRVTEKQVFYNIDTAPGQSGCPVLVKDGDDIVAVGVHNYGGDGSNFATRITDEVFTRFESWKNGGN